MCQQKESDDTNSTDIVKKEESKVTNFVKKCNKIRKVITVEPLIGLYQFAIYISKPALENLELEKACRVNFKYNDTVCDAILSGNHGNYSQQNDNMQIIISKMHAWQQPIQSFFPLILILFLGSYSDRHKWRKPFFIFPLVGDILGYLGSILSVANMRVWSLEVQGFLNKIVPSIFGTQPMIVMATTSYIADVSTREDRTLRIGLATLVINVTIPVAQAISGILFKKMGYFGVLSLSCVILLTAFVYGVFWITETSSFKEKRRTCRISDVCNPKDALSTLAIVFKKDPFMGRLHLLLVLAVLQRSASDGEENMTYLYVQKKFQWTPVDYSYFRTTQSIVTLLGNICGLYLFVKILKMNDLVILFITVFTRVMSQIIFGCANTSVIFYSGILLVVVTRLNRIAKRSYATKIVSEQNIGKTISLLGIAEALAPVIAVPIYNIIYQNTLETLPSTIYFFSVLLYSLCCFIIIGMYWMDKRSQKTEESVRNNTEETIIESTYI
ncbi:unnamed protein product [Phyllotreta striolata]|uniref:Solute carrier family 46 member 3 n=1 Tax=Phyllotreta striolata TaxID=444603 RepID=A0A9N9TPJ6_PHYSR|nr:unnamed protein product [Phyllotreta striolata]